MKNEIEKHLLDNIEEIMLVESEDSEGDPVYRIELKLKSEKNASLTELWINNKEGLQKTIDTIKNFLRN